MSNVKTLKHETIICVDLRPFNPEKEDYGVNDYIEKLGFKPHVLVFLNFFIDFLHKHKGVDDTYLNRMTVGQRGAPAAHFWTKRQLYNLLIQVRKRGISPYIGILSFTKSDVWKEGDIHWEHEEIFQTKRGGKRLWGHCINPLKRFNDGRCYDDLFVKDLLRVIKDFNFDGYVPGDGMIGLRGPRETLTETDFSKDMVGQFKEYSNIPLPELDDYDERADFIVENHFPEWVKFYVYRWGMHMEKLASALKPEGKKIMAIDAWSRNPEEMITAFGVDYRVLYENGLDAVFIRAGEANKIRRHREGAYVQEENAVYTFLTHKAYEPRLKYYWAVSTINMPEFWNAILDLPHVIERENYAYVWTMNANEGKFQKTTEGVAVIWGNDLTSQQWNWISDKWESAYKQIEAFHQPIGFTLLWNETGINQLDSENKQYGYRFGKLLNHGICIQSCIHERELKGKSAEHSLLKERWFVTFDADLSEKYPQLSSRMYVVEQDTIYTGNRKYSWQAGTANMKAAACLSTSGGRVLGFENNENKYMLSVENPGNLFYEMVDLQVPFTINKANALPPREWFSIPETIEDKKTKVSVPPDASVQIQVEKKDAN